MAKSDDAAATMLRNIPDKTGKHLEDWFAVLKSTSLQKHGELIKVLKGEHGVTHGFANLIVIKYRESMVAPVVDLVGAQYSGAKSDLRPIYDKLCGAVQRFGGDVEFAPKKAYVSLRRKKQFGIIQPSTRTRVDVGLNLADVSPTKRLELSGSFNSMVTHRVRLSSVDDVDEQLNKWLSRAYDNAG